MYAWKKRHVKVVKSIDKTLNKIRMKKNIDREKLMFIMAINMASRPLQKLPSIMFNKIGDEK